MSFTSERDGLSEMYRVVAIRNDSAVRIKPIVCINFNFSFMAKIILNAEC